VSIALSLLILAGSVAALLGGIAGVAAVAARYGWSAEVKRKSVHVAIGLYALALPLLFDAAWPVVLLIVIALALMAWLRTPASRVGGLGAVIHSVERRSWGDIWLALAIGFVFVRAGGDYILYALPIAVIALSDAAAALAGTTYGRTRFVVEEGKKSWEGITVFFAVTLIVAMILLLLVTDIARANVVVLALAIAAFGATVEAVSWRGLDNLFVPICIHFFLAGYRDADPMTLAGLAAMFFAAIVAVAIAAPRLALSDHAARAFVIAIFLFLGVAGLYGTLLPLLLMLAHLLARKLVPCRSAHCDLDFLATLCGVGLIWYFVGETLGPSALTLYNLGLAGMLLGYLVVIARHDWRWGLAGLAAVLAAYLAYVGMGPEQPRWVAGVPWLAAASFLLVLIFAIGRAALLERWRAPRLAAVASVVPMSAYLWQAVVA